jgi:hypothetical protein
MKKIDWKEKKKKDSSEKKRQENIVSNKTI